MCLIAGCIFSHLCIVVHPSFYQPLLELEWEAYSLPILDREWNFRSQGLVQDFSLGGGVRQPFRTRHTFVYFGLFCSCFCVLVFQ